MTVSNEVKPAPFLTILIISIFFLRSLIFHSLLFFSRLLSSIKLTEFYLLNTVSLQFRRYISISIMIIRKESDWIENQIKIFRQLFYLRYPEQIRLIFLSPLIYIRKNVQRLRERNTNKKKKYNLNLWINPLLRMSFILTDLFAMFHEAHGIPGNSVSLG